MAAGPPSGVLTLSLDVKTPTLNASTDVLVRISYAGLNPGGSIMMQLCPFLLRSKPAIPELDFSGVIVAAGTDVPRSRRLLPGTPVFGSVVVTAHLKAGAGALAEYVVVDHASVVQKPANISFEEGAGLGVAGCTALLLVEKAGLNKGDQVLVNGASGGIGTMVVQMARDAVGQEGKIVAVCSGRNVDVVKGLGADDVRESNPYRPRPLGTIYLWAILFLLCSWLRQRSKRRLIYTSRLLIIKHINLSMSTLQPAIAETPLISSSMLLVFKTCIPTAMGT